MGGFCSCRAWPHHTARGQRSRTSTKLVRTAIGRINRQKGKRFASLPQILLDSRLLEVTDVNRRKGDNTHNPNESICLCVLPQRRQKNVTPTAAKEAPKRARSSGAPSI